MMGRGAAALWVGLLFWASGLPFSGASLDEQEARRAVVEAELSQAASEPALKTQARRYLAQATLTSWIQGDDSNTANHDFGTVSGGVNNKAKGKARRCWRHGCQRGQHGLARRRQIDSGRGR